jgi:hypothetical protein
MEINWLSKKGNERDINHDFLHIIKNKDITISLLIDASEKGSDGAGFSHYWGEKVITQLSESSLDSPLYEIINIMRSIQPNIRFNYLHETASFLMVRINSKSMLVDVIFNGDCRLACKLDGDIVYKNNVHTMANRHEWFEGEHYNSDLRHLVTRCLNAKRFYEPEVLEFSYSTYNTFMLMSDGYWAEHLGCKVPFEQVSDDASLLLISPFSNESSSFDSEIENYSIREI